MVLGAQALGRVGHCQEAFLFNPYGCFQLIDRTATNPAISGLFLRLDILGILGPW